MEEQFSTLVNLIWEECIRSLNSVLTEDEVNRFWPLSLLSRALHTEEKIIQRNSILPMPVSAVINALGTAPVTRST